MVNAAVSQMFCSWYNIRDWLVHSWSGLVLGFWLQNPDIILHMDWFLTAIITCVNYIVIGTKISFSRGLISALPNVNLATDVSNDWVYSTDLTSGVDLLAWFWPRVRPKGSQGSYFLEQSVIVPEKSSLEIQLMFQMTGCSPLTWFLE